MARELILDEVKRCVEGEVIAAYKPYSVSSVYVVCEPPCTQRCTGINLVSVDELLGDAQAATLGELVASTLLAPPEHVEGDEAIIEEAMSAYHYRVLLEEHRRLKRLLRGLAEDALVAIMYHLFARASRLQRFYPWAGRGLVEAMKSNARLVYELAARSVEEAGCKSSNGVTRVCEKSASRKGWRHLAGRLTRLWPLTRPGGSDHPLLRDPLLLVRLRKARIRTRLMSFEEQAYRIAGLTKVLEMVRRGLGGTVTVHRSSFKSIIVKRYATPATAKWIVAAGLALPIYPYRLSPWSRLEAEYLAVSNLDDEGIPVPKPLLIDIRGFKAAYEYIEGKPLHQLVSQDPLHPGLASAARLLAAIHEKGWVVGDANPSNFIVRDKEEVYIVDLEQARRSDSIRHKAWDIAVLLYYSFLFNPREPGKRALVVGRAYIEAGGDPEVVREATKVIYSVPFVAVTPVTILDKARKGLLYAAHSESGRGFS